MTTKDSHSKRWKLLVTYLTSRAKILKIVFVFCCLSTLLSCDDGSGIYHVSVHQLRIQESDYINKKVVVSGYFSRAFSEKNGPLFLYATKDDADMRNNPAGIAIKFIRNDNISIILPCLNHFVSMIGIYQYDDTPNTGGGLRLFVSPRISILDKPKIDGIFPSC